MPAPHVHPPGRGALPRPGPNELGPAGVCASGAGTAAIEHRDLRTA